ncbi:MAG: hypothetical protein QMC22_02520 [Pseudomonadales bacterium]
MKKLSTFLGKHSTRILFTLCILMSFSTASSWASMVSLNSDEIQDMEPVNQGAPAFSFMTNETDDGAIFLTFWLSFQNGYSSGSMSTPVSWSADWSEHTSFQQRIINRDESPWTFSMSIDDGSSTYTSNSLLLAGVSEDEVTANVTEGLLSFDFSTLELETVDLANIASVTLKISAVLPVNDYDRVAEYEVAFEVGDLNPVPLPASLLLFSSALALLILRRNNNKTV